MEAIDFVNMCLKIEELKLPLRLVRLGFIAKLEDEEGIHMLNEYEVTKKGKAFLNNLQFKEDLEWITTEYRKKFKQCNVSKFGDKIGCEKKVVEVMNEYSASKEEVLSAVDLYIQSLNGDYSNKMMSSADYFAKYTDDKKQTKSKLGQYIELAREGTDDWTKRRV